MFEVLKNIDIFELVDTLAKNIIVYICESGIPSDSSERSDFFFEIENRISQTFCFEIADISMRLAKIQLIASGKYDI